MNEPKPQIINAYLEKAKSKLKTAQILLDKKCFEDVVSRAYYAAFHAAQAALYLEGVKVRTHSGVVNQFGLLLVKTGKIEAKYGKWLSNLREDREVGDYEVYAPIDENDAHLAVQEATDFVKAIEGYVKQYTKTHEISS